jgi:signal transduction histidine kinase
MKTGAKAKDDRTNGPDPAAMPSGQSESPTGEKKGNQGQDFLGKSLDTIIAGVAVERARTDEALRDLTSSLIQAQEQERRRLARELHDGLTQQLAMLTMELGMLAHQVAESTPALRGRLTTLRDRAEGLCNDLRRMTHQLHPAALEHLGLVSALRSHCSEVSRNEGIKVWFQVSADAGSTPLEPAVCLYRITQEALRNVAKHSGAQEAWVDIGRYRDGVRLSIVDKGVGFDLRMHKAGKGLGLISIRERSQLLSGSVAIKSAPGLGTCVEVWIPLESTRQIKLMGSNHAKTKTVAG